MVDIQHHATSDHLIMTILSTMTIDREDVYIPKIKIMTFDMHIRGEKL